MVKESQNKTKFIGSFRFMSSSLLSLAGNLSEGLHNYKCANCKSCLDYISNKDNQLIFKCRECSKNHKKHFNKDLIQGYENTCEICHIDFS